MSTASRVAIVTGAGTAGEPHGGRYASPLTGPAGRDTTPPAAWICAFEVLSLIHTAESTNIAVNKILVGPFIFFLASKDQVD